MNKCVKDYLEQKKQAIRAIRVSGVQSDIRKYYWVFLGSNRYFVTFDVGNGRMQWHAFHKEAPRSIDTSIERPHKKVRLMELFGCWCNDVTTLIIETREEMVFGRDVYDREMVDSWGIGRVTLLGDTAHPRWLLGY